MIKEIIGYFRKPLEVIKDGEKHHVIHNDYKLEVPDKPLFKKPSISRHVVEQSIKNKEDYIKFINEYKTDSTKIFYDDTYIRAIFNYSTAKAADYADSYCGMVLENTLEFLRFSRSVDSPISQKQFIMILKQLEPNIVSFDRKKVDDMDIVEVAEHLQATKNINSVSRNTNKAFVIDAEVKTGHQSMTIPRYITFELPIYKNDTELKTEFEVELFLDASEGGFEVTMACYKLEKNIDETTKELTQQVCDQCGVPSFRI